jgi:hypothetical protein
MRGIFTKDSVTVAPGHIVSGVASYPHTVRVTHGRVWLTEEGRPDDYWLSAGDTFTVTPGRLVVIEADTGANSAVLTLKRRLPVWNTASYGQLKSYS